MTPLLHWLRRFNFIERARLERELWDAFERAEPIEQLVEQALLSGAAVQMDRAPGAVLDGEADGVIAGLRFPLPSLVPSAR